MNERPITPPQHIVVGDLWSNDVEIWLNGHKSNLMWMEVNTMIGWGKHYDPPGQLAGESWPEREVQGNFEIKWIKP